MGPGGPVRRVGDFLPEALVRPALDHALFPLVFVAALAAQPAVLHDNGPIVTHAGAGAGGRDVSALDNSGLSHPAHRFYGLGAQWVSGAGNSLADDFTVCGTWHVTEIEVFGYATNAVGPVATGVYVQIWDGDPRQPGSSVVRGDLSNNLVTAPPAGTFHSYRTLIGGLTATNREVHSIRVPVSWAPLPPGVYWFEYQLQGANFVPPVTEREVYITGNAIQRVGSVWADVNHAVLPAVAGVAIPIRFHGYASGVFDARQAIWGEAKLGSSGRPTWGLAAPILGRDMALQIFDGVPGATPMLLVGFGRQDIPIAPIGRLFTLPVVSFAMPAFDGNGTSVSRLAIPHGDALCRLEVDFQAVWVDAGAAGYVGHTNGMAAYLGGGGGEWVNIDVSVQVGKTVCVSLGTGSNAAVVVGNSHPGRATAATGARVGYWEVCFTGVAATGSTIVVVNYQDAAGKPRTARFWVTVKV